MSNDLCPDGAVVEFVIRVHADGRRERVARLLVPGPDGQLVNGPSRPTGPLGRFTAAAVGEALDSVAGNTDTDPAPRRRRVPIDERNHRRAPRWGRR